MNQPAHNLEELHQSLWRGTQLARARGHTLDTGYANRGMAGIRKKSATSHASTLIFMMNSCSQCISIDSRLHIPNFPSPDANCSRAERQSVSA